MIDQTKVEDDVWEALCCPGGCMRGEEFCWRETMTRSPKQVPAIMDIIHREVSRANWNTSTPASDEPTP